MSTENELGIIIIDRTRLILFRGPYPKLTVPDLVEICRSVFPELFTCPVAWIDFKQSTNRHEALALVQKYCTYLLARLHRGFTWEKKLVHCGHDLRAARSCFDGAINEMYRENTWEECPFVSLYDTGDTIQLHTIGH